MTDERRGDGDECKEVFGLAFVATMKSPAAGEPGDGAFYHPAVPSEAFGVFDASAGDARCDAA